jgi:alcohol dehydrogenase
MKDFIAMMPEKTIFGVGKINTLAEHVQSLGKKAIIVTGKSVRPEKTALIQKVQAQLSSVGIDSVVFAKVEENPTTITCDMGAKFAVENGCDLVIGLGGGSPMDASKFVALLAASGGKAQDYVVGGKFVGMPDNELRCLPIVLITTTSGTGSETTPYAVITNTSNHQKPGAGHSFWYANVSIVDPELTLSLPKGPTIHCGLDIFFHAMEAYVSNFENPFSELFAEKAMALVVENLQKCVDHPRDIEARSALALANSYAGICIAQSRTIAIHGLGHSIGGQYNAIHGASLCSVGPEVLRFCWKGSIKKFAKVAVLLGADTSQDEMTLAKNCADYLEAFLTKFDMNIGCASLGVKEKDIEKLANDAFVVMSGPMSATPIAITVKDAIAIYRKSM